MRNYHLKATLKYVFFGILGVVFAAPTWSAGPATFRIVSYMNGYDQPGGLLEVTPGRFLSEAFGSESLVFSVTSSGKRAILYQFPSGYNVPSYLQDGPNGRAYSMAEFGDNPATVFSIDIGTSAEQSYEAQNVAPILAQPLPDGSFIGIAVALSSSPWYLARIGLDGTVTTFYQFPVNYSPAIPIRGADGNYYGVASTQQDGSGYLYKATPSGTLTKIYNFAANTFTGFPAAPLLQAEDGNFYGCTAVGGDNGTGMIYKVTPSGQFTELHAFAKGDEDGGPSTLIEASDGTLYGTTLGAVQSGGNSLIFRITKSGHYSVAYDMSSLTRDGACGCFLVQGSDGMIYGTAAGGGTSGAGTIFALDAGLPKPKPTAPYFTPQSGAVGTRVLIWGRNLLSSSVQFNGVASSSVTVSGPDYVWAVVPAGTSSGPIAITTPGGTVTTKADFTVQ